MLNYANSKVKSLLLRGNVGLEKESLRVDENGRMAHTRHPFPETEERIARDFCENQTEINTSPCRSAREAVAEVERYTEQIQRTLAKLPRREYLWLFSNPPYIEDEDDVRVAIFEGPRASKTRYREYLANNYGRYKMAFSGIHFNFSFDDELLKADFELSNETDFQNYKNRLYLEVAEKAAAYGWILTAATAAFFVKGLMNEDAFIGCASARCSEIGYWNHFSPILNYEDIESYAASIQRYVEEGLIVAPTELYYPIRLKPRGPNNLATLAEEGVNHIELRMFDLNPLARAGVDERDVFFAQLFLIFMASTPRIPLDARAQVRAVQNFKSAARFDLRTVKIILPSGTAYMMVDAARTIIGRMKEFFADISDEARENLEFQESKFTDQRNRYPHVVRERFGVGFWRKGLELAKERQKEFL